jgi:hypothetical protein
MSNARSGGHDAVQRGVEEQRRVGVPGVAEVDARRTPRIGPRGGTTLALGAPVSTASVPYVTRDPRSGALHPPVKSTWPRTEQIEAADGTIPKVVEAAFESYLRCGIAEKGG